MVEKIERGAAESIKKTMEHQDSSVWKSHINSLHAINNYLWVCPYTELIWPCCVEMASLKAQLLTVSLRACIVPTDEKGRFHYDLEGCRYPSRVI